MAQSLSTALIEAKRRARLLGRPLSSQTVRGIVAGQAETASERLARSKALALQEEAGKRTERLATKSLESEKALQTERLASQRELQEQELLKKEALQEKELKTERELQAERLAEQKRAEQERIRVSEAQLAEQHRQADMEAAAAEAEAQAYEKQQTTTAVLSGAGIGGYLAAGTAMGGPIGAVIGAVAGFAVKKLCIIITVCTSPDSYEVRLAKEYQNRFMGPITHLGYHALAMVIVPFLEKSELLRKITKKLLVDRLVDYGEWILGYKLRRKYRTSKFITEFFLGICYGLGSFLVKEVYNNA